MNLGSAPAASNTGTVVTVPTPNGTFLMLGAGTCLALLVVFLG
jgi:hypothetical protein